MSESRLGMLPDAVPVQLHAVVVIFAWCMLVPVRASASGGGEPACGGMMYCAPTMASGISIGSCTRGVSGFSVGIGYGLSLREVAACYPAIGFGNTTSGSHVAVQAGSYRVAPSGASHASPAWQRIPSSGMSAAVALRARLLPDLPDDHSPRGALKRALLPGWGQVYNRQYYKLPFVFAGLGAFVGGVVWMNDRYRLYQRAALYRQFEEDPARSQPEWENYRDAYLTVRGGARDVTSANIRRVRDNMRRNRDLLVVGSVLYYGLTILDAYVSAHLLAFDVDEDLSAAIYLDPLTTRSRLLLRVRL